MKTFLEAYFAFRSFRMTAVVDDDFPEMRDKADLALGRLEQLDPPRDFPEVVTLCGSTRFKDAFLQAQKELTLAGKIVLTVGCFPHSDNGGHAEDVLGEEIKTKLDILHKRKIMISDYIYVLNVDGYVGSSTRSEIDYARANRIPVHYLEESGR